MKKLLFTLSLCFSVISHAQVGVGTATPDASAQLDIKASDRGILIPRLKIEDLSKPDPVNAADIEESLLVYNIFPATGKGYYYWNGAKWTPLGSSVVSGVTTSKGAPTASVPAGAKAGDIYVNEDNGDIYTHDGKEWKKAGGSGGNGAPDDPNNPDQPKDPKDGDIYVDESTGDIYTYVNNKWTNKSKVVSADTNNVIKEGKDKLAYLDEDAIKSASGVTTGKGAPTASVPAGAEAGDIYVNEDNGDLYTHNGTKWVNVGGSGGNGAPDDPNNPDQPKDPKDGDIYVDESTGDIYTYANGKWSNKTTTGNITADTDATIIVDGGDAAALKDVKLKVDATKLKGIPAAALEPAGTANYVLTTDASGNAVWAPSGTGPAGPKGADGKGITSTKDNNDGTFTITYTDNTTFTTSNLKGEKGDKGDTGAQGLAGAKGADGSSAYQMWIAAGNTGTEAEFLASLVGPKGDPGTVPTTGDIAADTDATIIVTNGGDAALKDVTLKVNTANLKDIPAAAIKQGTNGQVLTTDNTGTTVWATPAAGADDQKLSVTAGAADTSVITLEDGSNITIKLEHPDLVITEDLATRTITIGMRPLKIKEHKITEDEYALPADYDILLLRTDLINPTLKLPTGNVPVGKRIYIANLNRTALGKDMVFEEQPEFLSLANSTLHRESSTMLVHVGKGRYMTVGHGF